VTAYINSLSPLAEGLAVPADWMCKREEIKKAWLHLIGGLPDRVPVRYERLASVKEMSHTRHHIRYDTVYGDNVTAYLLVPDSAPHSLGPSPAILALHPTANTGKDDIAVPTGREGRRYALELANRGYVVLAPDTITAGERKEEGVDYFHTATFYEQYPDWSAVGKMLADHLQGMDLLCSLSEVDPKRIGVIGHSLGGYNAYFLAGLDTRVRAVAISCGLSTLYGDPEPDRWGPRDWFTHLPKMTKEIAYDFHEIAALVAPTPFFCWIAQQDPYMPHWKEIGEAAAQLQQLYEKQNAGGKFQAVIGTSGHDFPGSVRNWAYDFLDQWLNIK
jgi:dienelactone hydrolase